MTIKSDSGMAMGYLTVMLFVDGGLFWLIVLHSREFILGSIIMLACTYLFVSCIIFNCRTLIMDSEGCTVCFKKFSRKYKWSELQTRRLEYYCQSGRDPRRGVVFAKRRVGSMNWEDPSKHAGLKPLFSCFYVTFNVDKDERTSRSDSPFEIKYYEVDEDEFMGKMHEWGVRIENGLPPEKRKKYPYDWA